MGTALCSIDYSARSQAHPFRTRASLVAADMTALAASVTLSVWVKILWGSHSDAMWYARLWPFLLVFVVVYAAMGLYSVVGMSAPEELRRATLASTMVFVVLAATAVSLRGTRTGLTWTLFLALAISVVLVPLTRALLRSRFGHEGWWGHPAVIFGTGAAAADIVHAMRRDSAMGLKPLAVYEEECTRYEFAGLPMLRKGELPPDIPDIGSAYAVVAAADIPRNQALRIIENSGLKFSRILIVQDALDVSCLWVSPKSVGGMLGLELPTQHALHEHDAVKRLLDILTTLAIGILAAPLLAGIAIWIKLDSRGPILYAHRRIGRYGGDFKAWKFRSMRVDADRALARYLALHPELRQEWEENRKLKHDPRMTRCGSILRRLSLDELPQLWNVLRGQMSLVGPRPIVHAEVRRYGDSFALYKSVRGGITGLWQVSGRNDTSYEERVTLDCFYVRNWSVWLDLCILFRTIGAVLFRKGAY